MFVEDPRKNTRTMRIIINQTLRGGPNLLENPKLFVGIVVSLNTSIRSEKNNRSVKKKRRRRKSINKKRRNLILIVSLRRNMVMGSL